MRVLLSLLVVALPLVVSLGFTIVASKKHQKKKMAQGKKVALPVMWAKPYVSATRRHDQFPSIRDCRYTWI